MHEEWRKEKNEKELFEVSVEKGYYFEVILRYLFLVVVSLGVWLIK